jgi:hypothetical protein
MVRHDVAVISELRAADAAFTTLGDDLFVEKLPHFRVRTELSVSSGVLGILDSPNTQLPRHSRFRDCLPTAAA